MSSLFGLKEKVFGINGLILSALVALLLSVFLQPRLLHRPSYAYQFTFDVSQSMNVEDMLIDGAATSRLQFSKAAARALLDSLPCGSRIGWSLFTERRVVALTTPIEVCEHYHGLRTSLAFIDTTMRWAEASGVGKALHQSMRAADTIGDDTQVIFLTDGQEAPPLRKGSRGMPKSDSFDVQGIIVGVGGTVPAPIPKLNRQGEKVGYWQADEVIQSSNSVSGTSHEELSARQDAHLSKLSRLTNFRYTSLNTPDELVHAALNPAYTVQKQIPVDLKWIPASLALFFLCLRFAPSFRLSG